MILSGDKEYFRLTQIDKHNWICYKCHRKFRPVNYAIVEEGSYYTRKPKYCLTCGLLVIEDHIKEIKQQHNGKIQKWERDNKDYKVGNLEGVYTRDTRNAIGHIRANKKDRRDSLEEDSLRFLRGVAIKEQIEKYHKVQYESEKKRFEDEQKAKSVNEVVNSEPTETS
jgi:hypothetical protein